MSPKKGYVAHHSIEALGHRVGNLGMGTLEETVRAVKEYPRPHNVRSLQRFLGLAVLLPKVRKELCPNRLSTLRTPQEPNRMEMERITTEGNGGAP